MNPLEQIATVFRAEAAELLDALGQAVEALPTLALEQRRRRWSPACAWPTTSRASPPRWAISS